MRILVVESDPALGTFLQRGLNAEQYAVDLASEDAEAHLLAAEVDYDAAILDLNFAPANGVSSLQSLRAARSDLPILVLISRARIAERVQLLDLGADDLVIKPFALSELSAHLRALFRRRHRVPEAVLCVDDLEMNRLERTVRRGGRSIELTPKEFSLLEYLMRNPGKQVTRAQIIEHVWNLECDTMTNIVDVYINYLRKKLDAESQRKLIRTVRGVGYQIEGAAIAPQIAAPERAKAYAGSL
ncbi:MAG TPA: response regulator transcription factor [Candidatus Acidoferrales bacterium]|nr:response regulator transcription factor [Candidatus Acidoferrales bacterium]